MQASKRWREACAAVMMAAALAVQAAEPLQITDLRGQRVTLAQPAQRIVFSATDDYSILAMIDPQPAKRVVAWNKWRLDAEVLAALREPDSVAFDRITQLSIDGPQNLHAEALIAHLAEHDFEVDEQEGVWRLGYQSGQGVLWVEQSSICVEARADGMELLHDLKMMIAGHLIEFCDAEHAPLVWEGDGAGLVRPPAFRILTVQDLQGLGPHFRRIRFSSEDLQRYGQDDNLHCKLLFPQPGVSEPEWPTLNESGLPRLPQGEKRLDLRTYTIRRIDVAKQWLEIDFVLHDDAGPGSSWAAQAERGQVIGMTGPGGRTASPASRMVLAGDETAVPAMARIAEALPDNVHCRVLAEVSGPEDELILSLPGGVQWTWLHRGACPPGESALLRERFEALDWQAELGGKDSRFVWVGAEFATVQHLRRWARETLQLEKTEHLMVAYWRKGLSEHEFK